MPKASLRKSYETPRAAAHEDPAPAPRVTRSQDTDAQAAAAAPAAAAAAGSRNDSDAALKLFSPSGPDGTNQSEHSHDQEQSQPESQQEQKEEEADEDDEEKDDTQNQRKRKQIDPAVGTVLLQAQDQARKRATEQSQPDSQEEEEEEEEEEEAKETDQEMEDTQNPLQQQNNTNENDNSSLVVNETDDDYVQEPDQTYVTYVNNNCKHLPEDKRKELLRELDPESKIYWGHFKALLDRYDLRWDIKFTDLYKPGQNEKDTTEFHEITTNAMLYDDWIDCCRLIKSDVPVLNEKIGIYIAIICGPDPNLTYNVEKLIEGLNAAFPNHGKSEEEMNSVANGLKGKLLDCTELNEDKNSRFIMKVGCILKQMLFLRLRNLIEFNPLPGQIQFKFFATKDLCPNRVLILEDLIKFSLWLEKRYSGNGEVYYGNKQVANHLLQQAGFFAKNGKFTYHVKGEETIKASRYKSHPKYEEYRSETNLNVKRAIEKREQSEEQQEQLVEKERLGDEDEEDEDTSNLV